MAYSLPSFKKWERAVVELLETNPDLLNENIIYQNFFANLADWLQEQQKLTQELTSKIIRSYIEEAAEKMDQSIGQVYITLRIVFHRPSIMEYMRTQANDAAADLRKAQDDLIAVKWPGILAFEEAYKKIMETHEKLKEPPKKS